MSVSWSPDGTRLASGSVDKKVCIWEVATGKELSQLKVDSDVFSVAYSPDGTKLAAGLAIEPAADPSNGILVFDTQTNEQICSLRVDSMVLCLSYAPSGDMLAVGDYNGNIHFFNAQGEKLQSLVRGHSARVNCVDFSPDGLTIASCSGSLCGNDNSVRVWDVTKIVPGCGDGKVQIFDSASGTLSESPAAPSRKSSLRASTQALFSKHRGALEQRANGYVVAARGSTLCIFRTMDGSAGSEHAATGSARGAIGAGKPETAAVAFFQCSSDINAFDVEGGNIAVGCADGQVLQLSWAAVLQM